VKLRFPINQPSCLLKKRRSRRYSLTGAWPARTGNLVPGLAREGCASLLQPSLWLFGGGPWWLGVAGVSGYGACVARADSGSDWPIPAMAVEFFVWIVYSLSFHSVSLQWANIVWTFRWLYARPGLLSLVGLCFIVLRGPICMFI